MDSSTSVPWLDHKLCQGFKAALTTKLIAMEYPLEAPDEELSVKAFINRMNSVVVHRGQEIEDFSKGQALFDSLMKMYQSFAKLNAVPSSRETHRISTEDSGTRNTTTIFPEPSNNVPNGSASAPTIGSVPPIVKRTAEEELENQSPTKVLKAADGSPPETSNNELAGIKLQSQVEGTFESLWAKHRAEIEQAERNGLTNENNDDNPIIKYHRKSGAYPYLSENYPSVVEYEGIAWPTAQHAFQGAKVKKSDPDRMTILETIKNEPDIKKVRKMGQNLDWDAAFEQAQHRLEVMFRITYSKFQQRPHLAFRLLHDTSEKPIWHVCDDDSFWGTSRWNAMETEEHRGPSRSETRTNTAAKEWWSGDNWNGKILSVVRILLRQQIKLDPKAIKAAVEEEVHKHCPCPQEFSVLDASKCQKHSDELKVGAIIAGVYQVEIPKKCKGLGSFVGDYCYICKDLSPCDVSEEDTIRECLAGQSLTALRDELHSLVTILCTGGKSDWSKLFSLCDSQREKRFFKQRPRKWWVELENTLRAAQTEAHTKPLHAAYAIGQLLPSAPLVRESARPRVFVKTFKKYDRKVFVEIQRCSSKAPDFSRNQLQDHPNLSAIYGASHAGSISNPDSSLKLAFVALEHCEGQDLYDFTKQTAKNERVDHDLIRGIFSKVVDAVSHLHSCNLVHGDLKTDNIVVDCSGTVKLIDYGGMTLVEDAEEGLEAVWYSEEFVATAHCERMLSSALPMLLLSCRRHITERKGYPKYWKAMMFGCLLTFCWYLPFAAGCPLECEFEVYVEKDHKEKESQKSALANHQSKGKLETLKERLHLEENKGLRLLLAGMYAALPRRLTADQITQNSCLKPTSPETASDSYLASRLTSYFSNSGDHFLPDLDLVLLPGLQEHAVSSWDAPEGFLVCRVGPSVGGLQEGDLITHADGRRLALPKLTAPFMNVSLNENEVSIKNLKASALGQEMGGVWIEKLYPEFKDPNNPVDWGECNVDSGECRRRISDELAKALFGKYKSDVRLTVWRRKPLVTDGTDLEREYTKVKDEVVCLRTRDSRRRAPAKTPERFRESLLLRGQNGKSKFDEMQKDGEEQRLLEKLQAAFCEWQREHEASAGWTMHNVLATWRRKGLVTGSEDGKVYRFVPSKWVK